MAESIESVFTPAKKSRSSRRPIVIPQWLRRSGEQWSRIPNVESVLLFGSRATGHAVPSSDWDVAILHTGTESPRIPVVAKRLVETTYLSVDRYCREAHLVGSLAHELALHAMLIAGHDNYRIQKELGTSEDDLNRLLRGAFEKMGIALISLHRLWSIHNRPLDFETEAALTPASTASGDGAEHVAKALCVHLGISYEHSHDVAELSEQVPDAWKDKVLSMDGDTHATHVAGYTGFDETCGSVLRRIDNSLSLLSEFLKPCLEQMSQKGIRALVYQLYLEAQATSGLDPLRATEDIHPRIRDLLRRFDANMELVFERNRSLDRSRGLEEDGWDR